MANIDARSLIYFIYSDLHERIEYDETRYLEQARTLRVIWLVTELDGQIANGGMSQMLWNLSAHLDREHLVEVLETIGATDASTIVAEAIEVVEDYEERRRPLRQDDPFDLPAELREPLDALTARYRDLDPSVLSQLSRWVEGRLDEENIAEFVASHASALARNTETLLRACKEADLDEVRRCLEAGVDIENKSGSETALTATLGPNRNLTARLEVVRALLEAGADPMAANKFDRTPLLKAIYLDDGRFIDLLIESGVPVDHTGEWEHTTPLFRIFDTPTYPNAAKALIENGADVNYLNNLGRSPLGDTFTEYDSWADRDDNPHRHEYLPKIERTIDILLDAGARCTEGPDADKTCLAPIANHIDMLCKICQHPVFETSHEAAGGVGPLSATHLAAYHGDVEALEILLEAGASVDVRLSKPALEELDEGATPLDAAVAADRKDAAELLRRQTGADAR